MAEGIRQFTEQGTAIGSVFRGDVTGDAAHSLPLRLCAGGGKPHLVLIIMLVDDYEPEQDRGGRMTLEGSPRPSYDARVGGALVSTRSLKRRRHVEDGSLASLKSGPKKINADHQDLALAA